MIRVKNKITFDKYSYLLQDLITNNNFDLYKIIPIEPHPLQSVRECKLLKWGSTGVVKDTTIIKKNTICFETLWGDVTKIVLKLSMMFPDITISYSYVSGDIGTSAGVLQIKNSEIIYGHIPRSLSKTCYELSFKLWGEDCKKDYVYDNLKNIYILKEHYNGTK